MRANEGGGGGLNGGTPLVREGVGGCGTDVDHQLFVGRVQVVCTFLSQLRGGRDPAETLTHVCSFVLFSVFLFSVFMLGLFFFFFFAFGSVEVGVCRSVCWTCTFYTPLTEALCCCALQWVNASIQILNLSNLWFNYQTDSLYNLKNE